MNENRKTTVIYKRDNDNSGWSKAFTYKLIEKNKLKAIPTNSKENLLPIRVEMTELEKLIKGVPEDTLICK